MKNNCYTVKVRKSNCGLKENVTVNMEVTVWNWKVTVEGNWKVTVEGNRKVKHFKLVTDGSVEMESNCNNLES